DHMLDAVAQELHGRPVVLALGAVEVVLGYSFGQALELVPLGHWGANQRRALELELILVRGPGRRRGRVIATWILGLSEPSRGAGEMARIRPGAALAVDDVEPAPISAEGDVMRFVGRRDQAGHPVGVLAPERDHGHGVRAGVDGIEGLAIGGECHRERRGAGVAGALLAVALVVTVVLLLGVGQDTGRGAR